MIKDQWHCRSSCWSWWWLWAFLTEAGVLDHILNCLHVLWRGYVINLVKICRVWRHQEPFQRSMTLLVLLLGLMMIMDISDWDWCPWWCIVLFIYTVRKLCLKFGWNLLSLKGSKTLSKIDDIAGVSAGVDDDYGNSWLELVSLMTFWFV